nr:hypothetical protein HmN_000002500 [Hymenolepis microstoma]
MSNVQFTNAVQYSSVPNYMIPDSWLESARLPQGASTTNIRAYVPVSMFNNIKENQQSQQPSPLSQYAASIQAAVRKPPICVKKKPNADESVTKIILSNFDGPITVTCTDVTPRPQNLPPGPQSQFIPYQPTMFCPKLFDTMEPYYRYYSDPPNAHKSRSSQSKKKASRKRSKSLKKEKSKEKQPSKKENHKTKLPPSANISLSNSSPPAKTAKPGSPPIKSTSTTKPSLPHAPTTEQLQTAVLRPLQSRPSLYTVETTQTTTLSKSEMVPQKNCEKDHERSKSPEIRSHPYHCMPPMIYCMPSYPLPCRHQSHPGKQMQRLFDICEGSQQESVTKPAPLKDVKVRQNVSF